MLQRWKVKIPRVGGELNERTTSASTLINTRRIPYSHPNRYYKAIRGESHVHDSYPPLMAAD